MHVIPKPSSHKSSQKSLNFMISNKAISILQMGNTIVILINKQLRVLIKPNLFVSSPSWSWRHNWFADIDHRTLFSSLSTMIFCCAALNDSDLIIAFATSITVAGESAFTYTSMEII